MKKIILSLVLAIYIIGCGEKSEDAKIKEQKKYVTTETVEMREINNIFKSDAVLESFKRVDHQTKKGGTITEILKKNGEIVKKGDLIMRLTEAEIEEKYFSSEALYKIASNNYAKFKSLYEKKLISYLDYINYENLYIKAKAEYKTAKDNFEDLFKKAEISGLVGNLFEKVGEELPKETILFSIIDDSKMESYVGFPAEWLNKLEIGGKVKIEIPSIKKIYDGKIVEINPIADKTTKKYMIKVSTENKDRLIKEGMYSYVSIPTGKNIVMTVPDESIFIKDLISYVYIVKNGKAKILKVETGAQNFPYTEVYSKDLKVGDKVVVKGIFGLEDGMKVEEKK